MRFCRVQVHGGVSALRPLDSGLVHCLLLVLIAGAPSSQCRFCMRWLLVVPLHSLYLSYVMMLAVNGAAEHAVARLC